MAATVIAWLVFSVMRKVFGLVLLGALALGGVYLWSNPEALHSVILAVQNALGGR